MPTNYISVVIPYYQKKKGILSRAIGSILSQSAFDAIGEIVIVDDGSPIPATDELSGMDPKPDRVKLIRQPSNRGVARARNTALDYLKGRTEYVAFLDSDDIWAPRHIADMTRLFEASADFYFCNHFQLNQTVGAFERGKKLDIADHKPVDDGLYIYQGDMVSQIFSGNIIGTSTVGYRFSAFDNVRFNEQFKYAGEDYIFWLDLVTHKPVIGFSTRCNVKYCEGVNIFSSARWGTAHLHRRIADEISFRRYLLNTYDASEEARDKVKEKLKSDIDGLKKNFKSAILHGGLKVLILMIMDLRKNPKLMMDQRY